MAQTLFNRTVGFHLPSAIPTQLERIDEFTIGKVLIYSKKPKRFTPWRKHELSFTGWSVSSLLAPPEDQKLKIATASSFLFDLGKGSSSATVQVNLDAELNLHDALVSLDAKLKVDDQKKLSITSDLGKVTHVSTDLLSSCSAQGLHVNTEHPIVQEAMEKGGAMFVITSMYTAERCNIQVSITDSKDETVVAGATGKAGGGGDETVKDSGTSTQVISRNEATPIAYLLLRLEIGRNGVIKPQLNTHLKNVKNTFEVLSKLGSFSKPPDPRTVQLPQMQTQESQDFRDWIIIDVVEETSVRKDTVSKATGGSEAGVDEAQSTSKPQASATGGKVEPSLPLVEEAAVMKVLPDLSARPPPLQVNTPYATPMSEVQAAAGSAPHKDEPDSPHIDQHYVYSLRDFQPFESGTYKGILGEVEDWVTPLVSNVPLQTAFLHYIQPPRTLEKLKTLTTYLLEYGNALRTHKETPVNSNKAIDPILSKLSTDIKVKLDEVTSMIVTSEAMDEFPQFFVMKAVQLPNDKRQTLVDFICQTPYGTDRHVYTDVGPYKDPDLYPFMTKMGFSLPSGEHHLIFSSADESTEEDILAAGLILLMATKTSSK